MNLLIIVQAINDRLDESQALGNRDDHHSLTGWGTRIVVRNTK
ncbi:hypothetical protein [Leptolyngbya sp. 'hensonii']|nr:hypothetical protein [Leptolyngbya sp. 'hensonii']